MGLLDKAVEAADRQAAINQAHHAAWVLQCEQRDLDAARFWWQAYIGESADFWLGRRWRASDLRDSKNPYPYDLDDIIVTCDGWAFEIRDEKESWHDTPTRCALLIFGIETHGWPRYFQRKYGTGRITSMASMGRVLKLAQETPDAIYGIENLAAEGYGQLMQEGRY